MGKPGNLAEARAFFDASFSAVVGTETVALDASVGRRLAEDIVSPADLPRFDAAAMDGFALRAADLAPDRPSRLRIGETVAAGHPPTRELARGEASRIYTGAMIPAGAERVVAWEHCAEEGAEVLVAPASSPKRHVRRRAEDVRRGEVVLRAGQRIGAGQVALLSGLQFGEIAVFARLSVALLSVGDELRDDGELGPGTIADSNRPMLRAMLAEAGCDVRDLGILPDEPDRILAALVTAAQESDLILTSGGASAGGSDHLHKLIARRGCLEFWKLAMRPGKPVGFGDIDDCPILALPGNPLAAAVGFVLLGRPLLSRLSGDVVSGRGPMTLPLAHGVRKGRGRTEVLAGRIERGESGWTAAPLPSQGSASLAALARASGLIVLPPEPSEVAQGDLVEFVPL